MKKSTKTTKSTKTKTVKTKAKTKESVAVAPVAPIIKKPVGSPKYKKYTNPYSSPKDTVYSVEKEYWTDYEYECPIRGLIKERVKIKRIKSKAVNDFQTISSTSGTDLISGIEIAEEIMTMDTMDTIDTEAPNSEAEFY